MNRRLPPSVRAAGRLLAAALVAALLVSCSASTAEQAAAPQGANAPVRGEITVFAAASLTGAFEALGRRFEQEHPGTTVKFSFGGSSALATQITQGAPGDVFASASARNMDAVVAAKAAGDPQDFARNAMQIAVPRDNPAGITALADLARPGVKVALCQPQVPCGSTAAKVLANAKLSVRPVTEEADVKATLAKVQLGEVDAGLVYVTDLVAAGGKVTGIDIPADVNASTSYPIAALTASRNPGLARAFVAYVRSPDGARVLAAAGFSAP